MLCIHKVCLTRALTQWANKDCDHQRHTCLPLHDEAHITDKIALAYWVGYATRTLPSTFMARCTSTPLATLRLHKNGHHGHAQPAHANNNHSSTCNSKQCGCGCDCPAFAHGQEQRQQPCKQPRRHMQRSALQCLEISCTLPNYRQVDLLRSEQEETWQPVDTAIAQARDCMQHQLPYQTLSC